MLGKPIDSGDVLWLAILATAIVVVLIARFARMVKPIVGFSPPPSPETIARVSRNMRTSTTLIGLTLGLEALSGLLMHRAPEPVWWSVMSLQVAAVAALLAHLVRQQRERRRLSVIRSSK
jgi:hypothetical protein